MTTNLIPAGLLLAAAYALAEAYAFSRKGDTPQKSTCVILAVLLCVLAQIIAVSGEVRKQTEAIAALAAAVRPR